MSDIAKLTVALYANSAQFTSELKKSQKKAKNWSDSIGKTMSVAAKATAGAAVAAAGSLALIYNQQAELIDQTAKFADRIGISTEALSQFRHAAELTGVGSKNLDMSLQRMTRRISEAAQGSGEAAPALKQLGLDAQALGQMTPDQQLHTLADAFTNVESQSERVRLAFKLFDSEGVGMVNMLAGGSEGLKSMADEADRLGITLSRIDAAKVEMANDAMYKVNTTTTALKKEITTQLAPILGQLADDFVNFAKEQGGMSQVVSDTIGSLITGIGYLADAFRGVQLIVKGLVTAFYGWKSMAMSVWQNIVDGAVSAGQMIVKAVVWPLQKILDGAGMFNDKAAEMAKSLNDITTFEAPQLFDAASINQSKLDLNNAIWELRDLASKPLPSEGIDAWYQNTKAKWEQAAKDYANTINYNTPAAPTVPTSSTGTEQPTKEDPSVLAFKQATGQLEQEWQRRLAINAAGDQADFARESFAYDDRMARLSEQFQAAYEAAANNQAMQQQLEDQYFASRELLWQEHQNNITDIEKKAGKARQAAQIVQLRNYSDLFGSMADVAGTFAGEQSGIFKAMFAASKAFAIAESIVKIQQGIASAAALPFPANIPAMASVAATTAGIVSTIQSTQMKGMAHNGISSVPSEGTWLLDKGERVYTNESAKQLDQMYSAVMANNRRSNVNSSGEKQPWIINIHDAPPGTSAEVDDEQKVIRIMMKDASSGGQYFSYIQQKLGVQPGGYK